MNKVYNFLDFKNQDKLREAAATGAFLVAFGEHRFSVRRSGGYWRVFKRVGTKLRSKYIGVSLTWNKLMTAIVPLAALFPTHRSKHSDNRIFAARCVDGWYVIYPDLAAFVLDDFRFQALFERIGIR